MVDNTKALISKESYDFNDLINIMSLLRNPQGCPWDQEQTHSSIRKNLLEEAYEVAEAIDEENAAMLKEELGDLLLQVVFHAEIAKDAGSFDISDVCGGICRKLILRHPHIFGNTVAKTAKDVLNNWDEIKRFEKGQATYTQTLRSVPKTLPALMKSQKLQNKAAKAGFDWQDINGPLEKHSEEISEFREALLSGDKNAIIEELGDVLFSVVNIARFAGADAEEALTLSNKKFVDRFERMENLAAKRGLAIDSLSLEELDRLWTEIKHTY